MASYTDLIKKIQKHTLGDKQEATTLYFELCDCLKDKYGLVDRDYDDKPTKRGKEWIDIHHIREYELDDIARRTDIARDFERRKLKNKYEDYVLVALKSSDWNHEKMEEIRKQYSGKSVEFWGVDYSLQELKPYNVKEQLVYANKIEHFLLHYLIVSMKDIRFAGGPNYLWDCCMALDVFGFKNEFMNELKKIKNKFYSIMSIEEVTILYKKLIDYKGWNIYICSRYWMNHKHIMHYISENEVSYVENPNKYFELLSMLDYWLPPEMYNKIDTLPYKTKIVECFGIKAQEIDNHIYSLDGKTALRFSLHASRKSFTVPKHVEIIANGAFHFIYSLEKIIIPITVKEIGAEAFSGLPFNLKGEKILPVSLKTICYGGSKDMWNAKFSNVELPDGVKLVYKIK